MKPPKRVLIFSLVYYPRFIGGAEVTIKEVTDRISPSEIEFDMVTLRLDASLPRYERVGNVNVYRVGWSSKKAVSPGSLPWRLHLNKYAYLAIGLAKALSLNRRRRYDAIWSLMATYNSFAAVFMKLLKKDVKFIFTLQDGDPIGYLKRRALPLYPFFKMMFTRADRIQAISSYLADWARDMGARCPVDVIPNAVDVALFSAPVEGHAKEAIAARFGKKEGDAYLVTMSRLVRKNAVGDLISSLSYLPANVKLLILGEGPEEKGLKELALRLGLNYTDEPPVNPGNRVHFVGYVPHAEMPPYLAVSDIFARPALSEGLGNSFLEAMAAGIPVIGTPVGGIPDFLADGDTGLFCEVGNPRSIAQKAEKLLKDPSSREHIVSRGKRLVEDRYTWEKVSGDMKAMFLAVC